MNPLYHDLHALACATAREAAVLVLARLGEILHAETKTSDIDLVTEVDRASEELISNRILEARPDDGILGEEGTGIATTSGVEWLVDPIDGTTSFFYGLPGFSISVAARIDHEVVAGAVFAPAIRNEYSAILGQGATLNGDPVQCREIDSLGKALVGTGFSPDHARRARQGTTFAAIIPHIRDIRRMGSAALELAAVGAGQLDAFYEVGLSTWDYAAGLLIASEGGAVTMVEPDTATGRSFVAAASPGVHEALFALIERNGAAW